MITSECTVSDCDRPTQEHLCHECTTQLQKAWDAIPDLVPTLQLIARKQEQPFTHRSARQGKHKPGPAAPMDLSALSLLQNFRLALSQTPAQYATHHDGWQSKERIEAWVRDADLMVNGEAEDRPTEDYIRYRLRNVNPMPVRYLLPWLKNKTGIRITKQNINDWARRGKLHRRNDSGHPTYHPVDVLEAHRNDRRTT